MSSTPRSQARHEVEVGTEAEHGEQVQCLLRVQYVRVPQDGRRAALPGRLSIDAMILIASRARASGLGAQHPLQHGFDSAWSEIFILRLAQRLLVGDLGNRLPSASVPSP